MRRHRVALMFSLPIAAVILTAALLPTASNPEEASYSWSTSTPPGTPQRADLLAPANLAPLATYFADVQHAQEVSALNELAAAKAAQEQAAAAAAASSSTASSGATSPTTTTTNAPAGSGVDQLLAYAPAYVINAFHCIAYTYESGGNPSAVNPSSGDGGLYQFAVGTWLGNGGGQFAPAAQDAPVWAQDTVAYWTWQHDGFSPWTGDNSCWS